MSRFFSSKYAALTPYTPGEQPQDRSYIKLNTNESPFPPSPLAQRMAREAVGDLQLYSDPECRSLIAAGAQVLGVEPEELVFCNSSDELLDFAFMAFCDKDHPAVFANITYGFYPVFAKFNGVPYEEIPLRDDFTIDPDDYIGLNKTIFIANPNAPTGLSLPLSDIERIVAGNPDSVVVVDEAYVDFGGESALPLTKKYDNLLVCRTFSKSRSLAGGRLGFGVANPAIIADLNTIRYSTNPYNVNRVSMAAGVGALLDTEYFEACCAEIQRVRAWTAEQLRALGFTLTDSKTNFLFAKTPAIGGQALYLALKERGVLVRHFETPLLKDYNRITVGSAEQMQEFIRILRGILEEAK